MSDLGPPQYVLKDGDACLGCLACGVCLSCSACVVCGVTAGIALLGVRAVIGAATVTKLFPSQDPAS